MADQKIVPHFWYDDEAMEAAEFYTNVFPDSRIISQSTLQDTPSGDAEEVSFELMGYRFMAISAGPYFIKNPSISFLFMYTEDELPQIEKVWDQLVTDGKVLMAFGEHPFNEKYGWVEDKYGVSWQFFLSGGNHRARVLPTIMFINDNLGRAQSAMDFYMDVFKDTEDGGVMNYPEGMEPNLPSHVMHAGFKLENQWFSLMDSAEAHDFNFNEGISFLIKCRNQAEVDYYWEKLSAEPEAEQCGWLKDRFGLSWQVYPEVMKTMLEKGSKDQVKRVTEAFLKMKKFDIATLESAYRE
ncbi:VOC family protein [Salinicoccus albus]|uniref:VOC family protein n=1 Tax=Salinicoccus albus TaxID=418756 RepID=UPI00036869C6|nr:VOC family protein [Salinicoccus albus]